MVNQEATKNSENSENSESSKSSEISETAKIFQKASGIGALALLFSKKIIAQRHEGTAKFRG